MITRIIIGLLVVGLGIIMVWKTKAFSGILGSMEWSDKIFGPGNEDMAYKSIGIVVIVIGFMIMTNLINDSLTWFFGLLTGGRK